MQIALPPNETADLQDEFDVIADMVVLKDARMLELGCGAAQRTRELVTRGGVAHIVASEVDERQHAKNLLLPADPAISFCCFGAQDIPEPDQSFDAVFMFKSLHHVPLRLLDRSLREIGRVLKPGGVAYISEPVFAGDFNEVIRMFHDESHVRREAFRAMQRAVETKTLELVEQRFFDAPLRLDSFDQFSDRIMNVTHTDHELTDQLRAEVRARFESFGADGAYEFRVPHRIDLLRRSSAQI